MRAKVVTMKEGDPVEGRPLIRAAADGVQAPTGRPMDPGLVTRPAGYDADAEAAIQALERLARQEGPTPDGERLMRAVEAWLARNGYVIVKRRPSQDEVQAEAQRIANTVNRRG